MNFSQDDIYAKIEQAYEEIYKNPMIKKSLEYLAKNDKIQMEMNFRNLRNLNHFKDKDTDKEKETY